MRQTKVPRLPFEMLQKHLPKIESEIRSIWIDFDVLRKDVPTQHKLTIERLNWQALSDMRMRCEKLASIIASIQGGGK